MMTVNAFWFGFLMGLIAFVVLGILIGILHRRNEDEIEPITIEELRQIIKEEMDGEEGKHDE